MPDDDTVSDEDAAWHWEQQRMFLGAILPFIQARRKECDPSDRVQLALDLLVIEASERARRIFRSDLPGDRS